MTLRFRRVLFYAFFIIFIPLSAGVIFYSQGWRFNFENFELSKTGAIYIETIPKDAIIEIDEKIFPDRSGIMQKGTLISNLPPETYKLKISKNGYLPYYKNLKVGQSLVSEAINVILIPEKISERRIIPHKLKGEEIAAANGQKIIVKNIQNGNFYLYDLTALNSAFNASAAVAAALKNAELKKIAFHPFTPEKLIIEINVKNQKSLLYILTPGKPNPEPLFLEKTGEKLIAWNIGDSGVYSIWEIQTSKNQPPNLIARYFNLAIKTENQIAELPKTQSSAKNTEIKISPSGSKIGVLEENGDLFIPAEDGSFKKIAHDAKFFEFSPDGKKIAFIDGDGKINIYFLEAQFKNISKKAEEVIGFNLENKKFIKNIFWHNDSYHLFIEYGGKNGKINFTEIDDRKPLNIYPVFENISDFYYDAENNAFYIVKNAELFSATLSNEF